MNVPLLDLKAQYQAIRDEIKEAVDEVLESQHFILGPKVEALEEAVAPYCGCQHAVGVSSGTDGLLIYAVYLFCHRRFYRSGLFQTFFRRYRPGDVQC
jgi:dTDP-4-amino-4,6-dideoxygalactose transaminase